MTARTPQDRARRRALADAAAGGRPIPPLDSLTVPQQRGRACVWCATPLDPDARVPLGEHRYRLCGQLLTWLPHACHTCAAGGGS